MATGAKTLLTVLCGLGGPATLGMFLFGPPRPWVPTWFSPLTGVHEAPPVEFLRDDLAPVAVHEMEEMDYWSQAEVFSLRRARVMERRDLLERLGAHWYEPSRKVFGAIEDGAPWWGILGLSYYGSGTEGPSEESRFLGNPYMLVGVDMRWAYDLRTSSLPAVPLNPIPLELSWSQKALYARVRYDVSTYFKGVQERIKPSEQPEGITLIGYNARDLGLPFMSVDVTRSKSVKWKGAGVFEIPQYLHRGPTCMVKGGCNNMSPTVDGMEVDIDKLPARIVMKMWRERPANADVTPSFWWIIDME